MTDEGQFERVVRERIAKAQQLTGHSFSGLLGLIEKVGAVAAARQLISPGNLGKFQAGMRVLFHASLLDLSVEQAIVEFGQDGKIFDSSEVEGASHRLQMMRIVFARRK